MSASTRPEHIDHPRIALTGLGVVRGGRTLLDSVDLRVSQHEIVTIEGPSGSGKSTLLRAIAALIPIQRGTITLDGIDVRSVEPGAYRRRVAYVPQQSLMFEGTVGDNVATGPSLRGEVLTPEAIDALLERVGLSPSVRTRPARDLSGGEKQRVAFARALANDPHVLLLDEPTSALDPESAARIVTLIRALSAGGLAIVVVTHSSEQARELGDRAFDCRDGRLFAKSGAA